MKTGGIGIWNVVLGHGDDGEIAEAAAELEELGYASIWIPGGGVKLGGVERLLAATKDMTVATGILSIWTSTSEQLAGLYKNLIARHGDRFLVGLGVSHQDLVDAQEPGRYHNPLGRMKSFLDGLDRAESPIPEDRRVLAALGPRMLRLAGDRAGGAHPYNVTPEHTARARTILGPGKLVLPEQAVVWSSDPAVARGIARAFFAHYLERPNYVNSIRRLGFGEDDLVDGGSDRLIDALIAWGDEKAIAARIKEHRDAGADQVCIQVLDERGMMAFPLTTWRRLAPVLTGV
jgi:probable F420-dependent oxidoreductase